jgi:hypothetical protein
MVHVKGAVVAVFLGLASMIPALTGAAFAQQQPAPLPLPFSGLMKGTPQEEAACAPDSTKFCSRFEPDPLQVLGCLQQNRTRISKACQSVLRNRGV